MLKSEVLGHTAHSNRPQYRASTAITTFLDNNDVIGACPVMTHQAGAAPGSLPRGGLSSATGSPSQPSRGTRGGSKATGKTKENTPINIMHWNAEGVSNKKTELQHFMHENQINICCIKEFHLKELMSFKVRGYQTFRSDCRGRTKGGVVTLVRNNISATETNRYMEEAEFIGVKIKTKTSELHVLKTFTAQMTKNSPLMISRHQTVTSSLLEIPTASPIAGGTTTLTKEERR